MSWRWPQEKCVHEHIVRGRKAGPLNRGVPQGGMTHECLAEQVQCRAGANCLYAQQADETHAGPSSPGVKGLNLHPQVQTSHAVTLPSGCWSHPPRHPALPAAPPQPATPRPCLLPPRPPTSASAVLPSKCGPAT